jgi:hypothetical protein
VCLAGVSGACKHFTFLLLEPKQWEKMIRLNNFLLIPVQYGLEELPPHFVKQGVEVSFLYQSNERCPIYLSRCTTCINDTGVHLELRISPRSFEKIQNGSNGILMGLGETDPLKNQKSKIS